MAKAETSYNAGSAEASVWPDGSLTGNPIHFRIYGAQGAGYGDTAMDWFSLTVDEAEVFFREGLTRVNAIKSVQQRVLAKLEEEKAKKERREAERANYGRARMNAAPSGAIVKSDNFDHFYLKVGKSWVMTNLSGDQLTTIPIGAVGIDGLGHALDRFPNEGGWYLAVPTKQEVVK